MPKLSRRVVAALVAVLCLGQLGAARADIIAYHPSSTLRLGGTFDPNDLTEVKPPCIEYDEDERPVDGVGGTPVSPRLSFFIRQVNDLRELYSYMNLSASVSGHYKMFSAGGSFHQEEENFSSQDSFSWVMGLTASYGRFRAFNPRLNGTAQDLVRSGDFLQFVRRCGTQAVLQVSRGVSAAVVFTIRNLTERNRKETSASFNASFGGGLWGLQAAGDFESTFRRMIERGEVTLDVRTVGGPGAAALAPIISDLQGSNSIAKVRQVLSQYVMQLGPSGSVPIEFQTAPMLAFVPQIGDVDRTQYMTLLGEYFIAYSEAAYMMRKYRNFLVENSEDYDATDPAIGAATQALLSYRTRLNDINDAALACRDVAQVVQDLSFRNRQISTASGVQSEGYLDSQERRDAEAFMRNFSRSLVATAREADTAAHAGARAMVSQGAIQLNVLRASDSTTPELPAQVRRELGDAADRCRFDPNWVVFAGAPPLPSMPFQVRSWSDSLGQSPDNYLHVEVMGERVQAVSVIDQANATLSVLRQNEATRVFRGLLEVSQIEDTRYPIRAVVSMRSGNTYRVDLLPRPNVGQ